MATGDSWYPTNSNQVPELRVVLFGTTGTGKSATGNTLLGDTIFESSPGRESVTRECSVAEVDRFGTRLVVVDTPGVLDTGMSKGDLKVMLKECTHLACPGVHAFLFLMKIGDRDIGGKDKETFDQLTEMYGEEFRSHTIVVFTAKECLGNKTLDKFISGLPPTSKAFINSCKGGYLAVSNYGICEKELAARQVVEKVQNLVQKSTRRYYTNKLFDEENEKIRKRMDYLLYLYKTKIMKLEREKQCFIASFKDHKPTHDQIERLREMEKNILQFREKLIDRKEVRLTANTQIKFEKRVKDIISGVAVVGGVVAAVATGGPSAVFVAGKVIQAVGTVAGYVAGGAVGGTVGGVSGVTARKVVKSCLSSGAEFLSQLSDYHYF